MNRLSAEPFRRGISAARDICFILFLVTEWLLPHTLLGQGAMALFCLSVALSVLSQGKLTGSIYFLFAAAMLLWGGIGLMWSVDPALSAAKLKTLLVNFVFLFCFYQHCSLSTPSRVLKELLLAVGVFILIVAVGTGPTVILKVDKDLVGSRFGQALGVNSNNAAFVTGLGFGAALWLGTGRRLKSRWYLLLLLPLTLVVALTSSLKGFCMLGMVAVVYLLLRYPKNWGWKLAGLGALGALTLYLFTVENLMARWPSVYYRVTIRLQEVWNSIRSGTILTGTSLWERSGYLSLGVDRFLQRPVTGWGLDVFRTFPGSNGTYSHNNYIELLVSGGLPLLLCYLAPYAAALRRGWKQRRNSNAVKLLLALTLAVLALDLAMVSYFDRTTQLVTLLLLCAATPDTNRYPALIKYLKNPFRIFSTLGSHGRLKLLGDRTYLRLVYRGRMGKKLRLDPPVTFTEKLQWMKLYDRNPRYPILADKLAVRDYVSALAGPEVLIELLGQWERAEDVDFDALPERFVLKCTHDSGGVRVCTDPSAFDRKAAIGFLRARLARNYFWTAREWAYRHVPPRVIAEAFIGGPGGELPDDYKFFCFNGEVKALCLCRNRVKAHADYFFMTPEFAFLPINQVTKDALASGVQVEKPASYQRMLSLARLLSAGLAQVRVDLYDASGRVYFGEMTLYDQGGFDDEYIDGGDERMGSYFLFPEKEKVGKEKAAQGSRA